MSLNSAITNLKNAIIGLISTHENKTGSSSQKGHVQAGGAPQTIGTSLSAGKDDGYYARADHVHTVIFDNILNKPETYSPSNHTHNELYINIDQYGDIVIGTTIDSITITGDKNLIQTGETVILTITAKDKNNNSVIDEPIQLYRNGTFIGVYNTNNNGQITYTHTGNASGIYSFTAKNCELTSQAFEIIET